MNKVVYFALDYYDRQVIRKIIDKYAMDPMEATRSFLTSETHSLLEDAENGLLSLSDAAIFDMWESERVTGDPRNSLYIRAE
ncbi:MAG: hypothetical protein LUD71_04505, partial [Clostridiales bacterium]|nr:hypothetical protein [Clostridiales bacterium]